MDFIPIIFLACQSARNNKNTFKIKLAKKRDTSPMNYAAQERSARSRQHLTLTLGPSLKGWALQRRLAWQMAAHESPKELLARIDSLRVSDTLWDLLEDKGPELLEVDRAICRLADCQWYHWHRPSLYEKQMEHSLQEVVGRAALEVPGVKPARIRYLLAREEKSGRLTRTGRGRYICTPREWQWLEPEERSVYHEEDERSYARFERTRQQYMNVLLIHYLILWPAYRKSKALEISERAYYYHLGQALDVLGETVETYRRLIRQLPNVQS